jgi:SNF2 family DNA or RNA helicase
MFEYGCHFLKTENVFDLPQQNFSDVFVDRSSKYRQFYKRDIVTVDDRQFIGDTVLKKLLYLRMLCGAYSAEKIKVVEDILNSTDDRLIIFYNFNDELVALQNLAKDLHRSVSVVNGNDKNLSAYENIYNSVTLIQYQSGAMGLNLQKANKIVYFTPPLSSELYEQSKKRIHRIGQNKPCFYYRLICKNSIEERIYKTLEERHDYTEKLFEKELQNESKHKK